MAKALPHAREDDNGKTIYPKMDKKIKTKWLKLLRSGKLRQTESTLHDTGETYSGKEFHAYCCLGVLVGVIHPEAFGNHRQMTRDRKSTRLNSSHMSESRMPSSA